MQQYLSNGIAVVVIALLAVSLLIVGIAYVRTKYPKSKIATDANKFDADAKALATKAAADIRAAATRVEPSVKADIAGVEKYIGDEFDKWLLSAEEKLTNTTAEDADIAEATTTLADANASKAARVARINSHVDRLQKFALALQSTLPTPAAGS